MGYNRTVSKGILQKEQDMLDVDEKFDTSEEFDETAAQEYIMDHSDRCDRCGAQAFVWAEGIAGDLMFCRHHFLKWEDSIRAWAFEIVDETAKINEKAGASA
jgi:ribosomal protein S14